MERGQGISWLWAPVLTLVSTLAGVILGGYLSHRSAQELFTFQKEYELKVRSYSRLAGSIGSLPWVTRDYHNAGILAQYYHIRYSEFSHDDNDRKEQQRHNDQLLKLQPLIDNLRREHYELLGDIQIAYKLDESSMEVVHSLLSFHYPAVILEDKSFIKTLEDLDNCNTSDIF